MKKSILQIIYRVVTVLKKRKQAKKAAAASRAAKVVEEIRKDMSCSDIHSGIPLFMGRVGGVYNSHNKSITINYKVSKGGLLLADTLYHEDRHFQQDRDSDTSLDKGYIHPSEDLMAYRSQHIEKDARRYAYVKVCRNCTGPLYKRMAVYKALFHPWRGLIFKIAPLEGKVLSLFKKKR